jgi:hypothetical protein
VALRSPGESFTNRYFTFSITVVLVARRAIDPYILRQQDTHSDGPTATPRASSGEHTGFNGYKSGQKCSPSRILLVGAEDASRLRWKERHWIGRRVNLLPD